MLNQHLSLLCCVYRWDVAQWLCPASAPNCPRLTFRWKWVWWQQQHDRPPPPACTRSPRCGAESSFCQTYSEIPRRRGTKLHPASEGTKQGRRCVRLTLWRLLTRLGLSAPEMVLTRVKSENRVLLNCLLFVVSLVVPVFLESWHPGPWAPWQSAAEVVGRPGSQVPRGWGSRLVTRTPSGSGTLILTFRPSLRWLNY